MKDWFVYVAGLGHIGEVYERTEAQARVAALSKYAYEGRRAESPDLRERAIFDDDEFTVSETAPPLTTGDGLPPPLTTG